MGKLHREGTINSEPVQPCGIHACYNCLVCALVTSVSSAVWKEGTEKSYHRQLPALELPIELWFGPSSPSCPRVLLFLCVNDGPQRLPSVIWTLPSQQQSCKGLVVVLPISISCLSTTLIWFVFCHLPEEVDSAAMVFLSLLTSLCFVPTCSHRELKESWGNSG